MASGPTVRDTVIVGAGMSGLAAALAAAQSGMRLTVLEADTVPGGSARWSSGRIWTLPDYASFRRKVPLGDPALQRAHTDSFASSLDWLEAAVGNLVPQPAGKSGVGRSMTLGRVGERSGYFEAFASVCEANGVRIIYRAVMTGIDRDGAGALCVTYRSREGTSETVTASTVILASGGYQGDPAMLARHFGPEADRLMVRSNPNSIGSGVRAGVGLDAAMSRGGSGFYGKSMPLGAERLTPGEYKANTLDVARHTIAVNIEGRRFVDEAAGISGEAIPNASIYQPGAGQYFLILDGSQAEQVSFLAKPNLGERLGRETSELMLSAATMDGLVTAMNSSWGVARGGLEETLAEVAQALAAGHGQSMAPPRRQMAVPFANPPFTAVACRPAITIPFGGLAIDDTMAVLDRRLNRIEGLYASGADAGGAYVGAYAGGLAWALTSGRAAGLSSANKIDRRKPPLVAVPAKKHI